MANTINNTTPTANTNTNSSTVVNPKSKLDGQAFMKLLLTQLKYQDPTQPMDSEKMLTQTSQLATLETQESTNKLMKELVTQLQVQSKSGANAYAISSIGKLASIGDVKLAVDEKTTALKFDLYLPKEVSTGQIQIKDKDNKVIRTIALEKGQKGVKSFQWDLKDNAKAQAPKGSYSVSVSYSDVDGKLQQSTIGTYPVEAVKFEKGVAHLKLGSKYVPISDIKEFMQG